MANLNKVHLIGNLTRDPELRTTPRGASVCSFGLAINRTFKDAAGQQMEETTFVDLDAWGKQGEVIAKYCSKGSPLYVEGRLRLDQWEDRETGKKRSRLSVTVEQFQFLGGRADDVGEQPSAPGAPTSAPPGTEEDVPF